MNPKVRRGLVIFIAALAAGSAEAGMEFPLSATASYVSGCWNSGEGLCEDARTELMGKATEACGVHRAELRSEIAYSPDFVPVGHGQCETSCTAGARFECVGW